MPHVKTSALHSEPAPRAAPQKVTKAIDQMNTMWTSDFFHESNAVMMTLASFPIEGRGGLHHAKHQP